MATEQIFGSWKLESLGSSNQVLVSHDLAIPLQKVRPKSFDRAWTSESLDGTTFHTIQVGSSLNERTVMIRYEDDPENLVDLLRDVIVEKKTLRIDDGLGNTDDVKVVEPGVQEWREQFEEAADFETYQEFDFRMTVRKTDGSNFNIPELHPPQS